MTKIEFKLERDYIELYKLLKFLDLIDSGGEAKLLIANGYVKRNGEVEQRKRAKIGHGERIEVADVCIEVL